MTKETILCPKSCWLRFPPTNGTSAHYKMQEEHGATFPSFVSKSRMQSKSSQVYTGWTQTRLSLAWLDISSLAKPPHHQCVVSQWQEATVNRQPTGKSDSCNPLGLFICWNLHGIYVCDSNKQRQPAAKNRGVPSPSPVQWITSATTDRRLNLQGHLSTTVHTRQYFAKISPFPFDQRPALFRWKDVILISLNL